MSSTYNEPHSLLAAKRVGLRIQTTVHKMKWFQLLLLSPLLLHDVYAQNQSFQDVVRSELGLAILGFVGLIIGMIALTWLCFCVCMCRVAYDARQERKIELAREEREFQRREREMRYRYWRDGSSRFVQQQHDIERSIMNRHQSKSSFQSQPVITEEDEEEIMLDSASVLQAQMQAKARAPQSHQQRMLSSFQSIPSMPYTAPSTTNNQPTIKEELDYETSSSINSDDIVDIMNMPAMIPRPRYY